MLEAAKKILVENIHDATTYEEFKAVLGVKDDALRGGGFVRSPWCGKTSCEDAVKEDTGACVYCGEPAVHVPLFARGY